MSLIEAVTYAGERFPWPDALTRAAIARMVGRTGRRLPTESADTDRRFAEDMAAYPIAMHTDAANQQHYEVPAAFFAEFLGPQRKYSCCFYENETDSLAEAEETALRLTAEHADLGNGQRILELGCGWGSLSLWMARRYPKARITAVSNSSSQRAHIVEAARAEGLTNLAVVTDDMNGFHPPGLYDRIVSIEMFEHMANWRPLLQRLRGALAPDGRLFIHVFSNRSTPYRFRADNRDDWIARHFFTGGIMPSHGLIRQFPDLFEVAEDWSWSGRHYRRTADDWLANYDRNIDAIRPLLISTYGESARLWERRWRLFFLATSGLFGHADGDEWGVSHYLLHPS